MTAPTARRNQRHYPPIEEILPIVGVVLGEDPQRLAGEAQVQAIEAMAALGYGIGYMSEVLGLTKSGARSVAKRARVPLPFDRAFVDQVAVDLVLQGQAVALRDQDLAAALRELAKRGKTVQRCAKLLRTDVDVIRRWAKRLDLTLAEKVDHCWWRDYCDRRQLIAKANGSEN